MQENNPDKVKLDLGQAWLEDTGKPMVFGVFAARKDTSVSEVKTAQKELLKSLELFESSTDYRDSVIVQAMKKSGLSRSRLEKYFGEVFNRLDFPHIEGLNEFLSKACEVPNGAVIFRLIHSIKSSSL